jgi:hypothetical protein
MDSQREPSREKAKTMTGLSPTQRTTKFLKEQGRIVGKVESFNPYAGSFGQRKDLFGFIDLITIDPVKGIVAVQSFGQAWSEHLKKLQEERNEDMYEWLRHAKLEMIGWRRISVKRGGVAKRWFPRIADVTLDSENNLVVTERIK